MYIFRGSVLHSPYKAMWGCLQTAVVYYFRASMHGRIRFSQAGSDAAHAALLQYGKLAEQVSPALPWLQG